ncbi:hypothetical protein HMPREF1991_00866 [Hoylesella loescheii DSM 19665 = JCM 12249 = ATCC 15930]|uniref:Uncharacterized protein n=1 Tax=Hoylesella loescheii DSM 19665 = JCM 12249 = ATCC 15930 TaxID=1122985 RepID=A0A069QT61_HOYLO|nr:hypothetical protein HMPREF1991_00866 [Hoylesella loescheii DSM 19665 = JCM 12249 = ATCC 15930]
MAHRALFRFKIPSYRYCPLLDNSSFLPIINDGVFEDSEK